MVRVHDSLLTVRFVIEKRSVLIDEKSRTFVFHRNCAEQIEEDIERSVQVKIVFCIDKESYGTDPQDQMRTEILSIPRNI